MPASFGYDDAVGRRFPRVRAAIVHIQNVENRDASPSLSVLYDAEQRDVAARLAATPIAHHASIAAWRRAFTEFGAKPTQHRNAAEALLRRLDKQGEIPRIGTLVDAGNLVSIRYALPVAVFDRGALTGAITVRYATGDEAFVDLGQTEPEHPAPGEVIFVDDAGVVCARRWCWRQSAASATGPATTEALVVIEGLHDEAEADVAAAANDLAALLAGEQPGVGTAISLASGS